MDMVEADVEQGVAVWGKTERYTAKPDGNFGKKSVLRGLRGSFTHRFTHQKAPA